MSGHCPRCGVYQEEDDSRVCSDCQVTMICPACEMQSYALMCPECVVTKNITLREWKESENTRRYIEARRISREIGEKW